MMRRPTGRLPFALQQSERKVLPTTIFSPIAGLFPPVILSHTTKVNYKTITIITAPQNSVAMLKFSLLPN
jgi:hypothetical protein